MQEIYELLCDVVGKEKDYTKEGIELLLKNQNVVVEYEDGIKTLCEILIISKKDAPYTFVRLTKGGLYQRIELFTRSETCILSIKNKETKAHSAVLTRQYHIEV